MLVTILLLIVLIDHPASSKVSHIGTAFVPKEKANLSPKVTLPSLLSVVRFASPLMLKLNFILALP